jgi:hypothetical protein
MFASGLAERIAANLEYASLDKPTSPSVAVGHVMESERRDEKHPWGNVYDHIEPSGRS